MAYKIFTVSATEPEFGISMLNQFLASHPVTHVERRFHAHEGEAFWSFCISYASKKAHENPTKAAAFAKVDYKEVLNEEHFKIFARLRELRKEIAEELSIPVFAIFTNEQLAEMSRRSIRSLADLRNINGIGDKKIKAYGQRFLDVLIQMDTQGSEQNDEETPAELGTKDDLFGGNP